MPQLPKGRTMQTWRCALRLVMMVGCALVLVSPARAHVFFENGGLPAGGAINERMPSFTPASTTDFGGELQPLKLTKTFADLSLVMPGSASNPPRTGSEGGSRNLINYLRMSPSQLLNNPSYEVYLPSEAEVSKPSVVEGNRGRQYVPYVLRLSSRIEDPLGASAISQHTFLWNNPTPDQMMSRGDFKAMVAHYRLRGSQRIPLLDGGVEGFTPSEFERYEGWHIPQIDAILFGPGPKIASFSPIIWSDGSGEVLESGQMYYSGVYSLTQNKLALLLSNMGHSTQYLQIPTKIGGKSIPASYKVNAGEHRLLEFTGDGTQWVLSSETLLFDDEPTPSDRNRVGVPEPATMGTLTLFGLLALARRGRRA